MRNVERRWPAFWAALLLAACGTGSIIGPPDPDEVSIRLRVSGGIAGGGYTVVVDGAGREVGRTCDVICTVPPGGGVLPVSSALVAELAGALEDAGVLALDGRDFGTQCCDQFFVELTYERGERSAHLAGTSALLPSELRWPLRLLSALAYGSVPAIVSPETTDDDWPRDPYALGEITVDGLALKAEVSYGGGCRQHRMDLVAWGGWLESFPVQIEALVTHDDGDDPCRAFITEERSFDLAPLARAYEEAYGSGGVERPTVILRLWDPAGGVRMVEVRL
ncbi:MAG TPA: hypothetical protein VLA09_00985 [Longimicrobiales bacterium]|nr:hypothetical protein [Longimicrobiales bacterium]